MTKTLYSLLAAAAMFAFATAANAGPVQMSDVQLDNVTAGAIAIGTGLGAAGGSLLSTTSVDVNTAVHGHSAFADGDVSSVALSAFRGPGAFAASHLSLAVGSP